MEVKSSLQKEKKKLFYIPDLHVPTPMSVQGNEGLNRRNVSTHLNHTM